MEERDILLKTIESLNASILTLSENHKKEVESLNSRIKELTAQVAWLNRQLFGRKSEKLPIIDPNYPDLFAGMLPENAQQITEAHDDAVEKIVKTKEERRQEKKNRIMMEDLPVLEQVILTPDNLDETLYKKIGQEVTRIVEHKPGQLYIKEIIREKWGLKDNTSTAPKGMSGVLIAPMPLLPIYKGIAGASLLAEILLQKYEYHMPYYRQIKQYSHLGMKGLTESTVDGWFKQTMELLKPLYEILKSEVMKADYVQADETTTPVINKETHKAAKEYLWMVRAVMERLVLFYYDQGSRAGAVIESLANRYNFKGYLQCDGFAGYETAFKTNPDVLLDNNLAENEIRPVTLGRKNYLFCGNHEAAQNMAVVCSLLATCRNHDVNPRDYLNDVISQMPYYTKASYEELLQLLPHKWKLTHPESVMTKTK